MNRADFYLLATRFRDDPLACACSLIAKAVSHRMPALILTANDEQAEALDGRLWEHDAELYIGHQIAGIDEDDDYTPVLIVPPGTETPLRDYIVNLRPGIVGAAPRRVAELIIDTDAERSAARERWQQYRALGFETHKHDL